MNARCMGGTHDGAVFELWFEPPPEFLYVFRCPHCDRLHHSSGEAWEEFLVWQAENDPDSPPKDEELYSLKEIEGDVAVYEQVGLTLPTPVEERELALA